MNLATVIEIGLFLLAVGVIFYFQLNKKILGALMKEVKIYLPFIEKDMELLSKMQQSNQNHGIIRSCAFNECIYIAEEDSFYEFDMLFFFDLACLISVCLFFGKHLLSAYAINQIEYDDVLNISNSFMLITIGYMCLVILKRTFNEAGVSSQTKQFIGIFLISAIAFNLTEMYLPWLLNINYSIISKKILSFLNSKLHLNPLSEASIDDSIGSDSRNKTIIQIVYSIIFGLIASITTISGLKIFFFDLFIMNNTSREEVIKETKQTSYEAIDSKIKLKVLLNIMILFNLIDLLSNNLILNHKFIYASCLILVAVTELCLNYKVITFSFMIYHHRNYAEAVDFCLKGNKEDLAKLKKQMEAHNRKFWEVAFVFLVHCLAPLLLILFYLANSLLIEDVIWKIIKGSDKGHWDFKQGFLESAIYVMLFAVAFVKGIVLNAILIRKMGNVELWNITKMHF